jgi:hypothetical protein
MPAKFSLNTDLTLGVNAPLNGRIGRPIQAVPSLPILV